MSGSIRTKSVTKTYDFTSTPPRFKRPFLSPLVLNALPPPGKGQLTVAFEVALFRFLRALSTPFQ